MAERSSDLIVQRPEGLYCPAGDFYIDPWRPVARAVITHAHADHARRGHGAYLATAISEGVLCARLGNITLQGLAYGETVLLNGVQVSLHPAGHVLGSAQVRLAYRGQVWVASGDYFCSGHESDANTTCAPFEPVRCDCFITESTFGLPIYRWRPQAEVMADINTWWRTNAEAGRASLLLGYSFGKAQRLLAGVDPGIGPSSCTMPLRRSTRPTAQPASSCPPPSRWRHWPTAPCASAPWCWRHRPCAAAPGCGSWATAVTRLPAAGCNCAAAAAARAWTAALH